MNFAARSPKDVADYFRKLASDITESLPDSVKQKAYDAGRRAALEWCAEILDETTFTKE